MEKVQIRKRQEEEDTGFDRYVSVLILAFDSIPGIKCNNKSSVTPSGLTDQ